VLFEMPVVTFLLGRAGIIDHYFLMKYFRHAIVVIFIIAAVVTPPDIISQFLLALPLIVLYLVSILVLKYTAKKNLLDR
jgi:sec-independent protein translocase protein TatC